MNTEATAARDAAEQARLDAALVELFQHRITFNQTLGLQVDSVQPGDVRASFAMRPELVGHYSHGRLHGGVISAVLDAVGGLAVMAAIAQRFDHDSTAQVLHRFHKMGTIDLRIDYLRPGLGQRFLASAEVLRLGGRIGNTQMRLVNEEGTLIATGAGAYVVS
jgi:uncharacterized protein (TIGR00369 family)